MKYDLNIKINLDDIFNDNISIDIYEGVLYDIEIIEGLNDSNILEMINIYIYPYTIASTYLLTDLNSIKIKIPNFYKKLIQDTRFINLFKSEIKKKRLPSKFLERFLKILPSKVRLLYEI